MKKPAISAVWQVTDEFLRTRGTTLPISELLVQLRPYAGEFNADRCVGNVQLWFVRLFEAVRAADLRATLAGVEQPDVLDSKDNVVVNALAHCAQPVLFRENFNHQQRRMRHDLLPGRIDA